MIDHNDESEAPQSIVEQTLRGQRDVWRTVVSRTSQYGARDLPREAPKRIFLFGVGSSYFAAKLCGFAILRDKTRIRIPVISCPSLAIGKEFFPTQGDWVFGFSHRGKTPSTLMALQHCRREGAFTVLVAAKGVKLPSEFQDLTLETCEAEKVEPHTVSVTSAICAVTTLLLPVRAAEEWDALTSVGDPPLSSCASAQARDRTSSLGSGKPSGLRAKVRSSSWRWPRSPRVPLAARSSSTVLATA